MMQSTHSSNSSTGTGGIHSNVPTTTTPDEKILSDLSTLTEQISLCQSMLVNAGGPTTLNPNTDEALLTVIGFLEACVPRMVELIEAAAGGALGEKTFEECLVVNDKLTNVLADVEKEPGDRTPLTPAAASSSSSAAGSSEATGSAAETDVLEGMNNLSMATGGGDSTEAPAIMGGKTTGLEDDPFAGGPDLLAPTPVPPESSFKISESMGSSAGSGGAAATASDAAAAAGQKSGGAEDDDDFDAFFRDRTAAP